MKQINDITFFNKPADQLAKDLIGKWISTNIDNKMITAQICETEAYLGINDSACHSYNNRRTERTEPMWQESGTIYVYLCYGLHYVFNIVCAGKGNPQAVLIRGVVGANGPAKATKLLHIDKNLNNLSVINNPLIQIYDDGKKYDFNKDKRIGIDYALDKDKNALLRFILKTK